MQFRVNFNGTHMMDYVRQIRRNERIKQMNVCPLEFVNIVKDPLK